MQDSVQQNDNFTNFTNITLVTAVAYGTNITNFTNFTNITLVTAMAITYCNLPNFITLLKFAGSCFCCCSEGCVLLFILLWSCQHEERQVESNGGKCES